MIFLFYLYNICVKVDLLKTMRWSIQTNTLTFLSNVDLAYNASKYVVFCFFFYFKQ